jgi:hypothetical protein
MRAAGVALAGAVAGLVAIFVLEDHPVHAAVAVSAVLGAVLVTAFWRLPIFRD